MRELIDFSITYITECLQYIGPIGGILLVLLESIIPALPLGVFITLNIHAFGSILGFFLSWIATCLGCFLSFFLFRHCFQKKWNLFISRKKGTQLKKMMERLNHISFSNFVVLVALPFTPAFLINISSGLSTMSHRKFIHAILLGKLSIVFFWGYIGKSLLESITDIRVVIIVSIILVVFYLLSKIVSSKLKIE